MNAKAEAIKLACEYAIKKWPAEGERTWCNVAVNHVSCVAGYTGFKGMIANEIVNTVKKSPDFAKVSAADAQKLAADGRLVIAGRMDEPHGHVAIIFPGGSLVNSSKWHEEAPTVANVGVTNGVMGSNWAFRLPPSYWAWIEG
jgi:uncharacterized protein YciI